MISLHTALDLVFRITGSIFEIGFSIFLFAVSGQPVAKHYLHYTREYDTDKLNYQFYSR